MFAAQIFLTAQIPGTVQGYQKQGGDYRLKLVLDFDTFAAADQWFGQPSSPGRSFVNYKLYLVSAPNTSQMNLMDVSQTYFDRSGPPAACDRSFSCPSDQMIIDTYNKTIEIPLRASLHSEASYLLEVSGPSQGRLDASISASPSVVSYDEALLRNSLKVTANVNLASSYPQPITVTRTFVGGLGASTETYKATVSRVDLDGIVLRLDHKLPATKGNPMQLTVSGITDSYGTAVLIKSKIASVPAAPTDLTKAFVTTQLSATAAVHSLPTFSGTGALAPWHPVQRNIILPRGLQFDPSVSFDVGSGNSKSTNAVTIPSQFIRPWIFGIPNAKRVGLPSDLNTLKSVSPKVLNGMFGPRAEFDTQYGGTNVLGETRAELYLTSLYQTSSFQGAGIAMGNPAIRDLLDLPGNGFSLAPYLQFDGGGHVTAQSITNSGVGTVNAHISTYKISRLYLGVKGTAQYARNTIALDGSWVDIFLAESVPFIQNKVVLVRRINGFQPHAKGTYSIYLDDAKHLAGSVSWENGRSAPSFGYLNKVTIGLQVTY